MREFNLKYRYPELVKLFYKFNIDNEIVNTDNFKNDLQTIYSDLMSIKTGEKYGEPYDYKNIDNLLNELKTKFNFL